MANNAAIKVIPCHQYSNCKLIPNYAELVQASLLQTKSTKKNSPPRKPGHAIDDAKWIKKVIQQEHIKPLEVSKDYVLEYERRERENADRLSSQVDRHISTLKNLRVKLEARHDLKARSLEYREWQKDFLPKKHAVMLGKTLDEVKSPTTSHRGTSEYEDDFDVEERMMNEAAQRNMKGQSSQDLTNVLDSLGKLAELENRITSLEKDNEYDRIIQKEKPSANQRTTIEFRKKRAPTDTGPVGVVYEVRPKQSLPQMKSWQVKLPGHARGTGVAAVRAKQQGGESFLRDGDGDYDADVEYGGPKAFLTDMDDNGSTAASKRYSAKCFV